MHSETLTYVYVDRKNPKQKTHDFTNTQRRIVHAPQFPRGKSSGDV